MNTTCILGYCYAVVGAADSLCGIMDRNVCLTLFVCDCLAVVVLLSCIMYTIVCLLIVVSDVLGTYADEFEESETSK